MTDYLPHIGDAVIAREKGKLRNIRNCIIGPVVQKEETYCVILNNQEMEIGRAFVMQYKYYDFEFLHKVDI